jgi:hypothetical protein
LDDFYTAFKCTSPLSHDDGKWITEIHSTTTSYDETEKEIVVGKAQFYLIDVESAINEGISAFWLFDEKASRGSGDIPSQCNTFLCKLLLTWLSKAP